MDGATPKATKSDRESYSEPNLLVVFVILAILPSKPSKTKAIKMGAAAIQKSPFMDAITE
jgi:hypothetical protein